MRMTKNEKRRSMLRQILITILTILLLLPGSVFAQEDSTMETETTIEMLVTEESENKSEEATGETVQEETQEETEESTEIEEETEEVKGDSGEKKEASSPTWTLQSQELKELLATAMRNDTTTVDVSQYNISIDLSNGEHILSDFQDDLFFEYAEDSFVVENMTFTQQDGKLKSIKLHFLHTKKERTAMRKEVKERIDAIIASVSSISNPKDKYMALAEAIWSDYEDDFVYLLPHTNDVYGCLIRGHGSRLGAAATLQACSKRLGYTTGYWLNGVECYNKVLINGTWYYTALNNCQSRQNNSYCMLEKEGKEKTYLTKSLKTETYRPISLFSDNPSYDVHNANSQYIAEQIMAGNANLTLPEPIQKNYRELTNGYWENLQHEYPYLGIFFGSVSINTIDSVTTVKGTLKTEDPEERAAMWQAYTKERDKIVARAQQLSTDRQKIICVNNYITKITTYKSSENGVALQHSHDQYGCLVEGKCVCEGYATAFYDILKQLGIQAEYVRSYNHIWTRVFIEGKWLVVDPTNNDSLNNYLLVDTHEFDASRRVSKYTYAMQPSLSMKSDATLLLKERLKTKPSHIDTASWELYIDEKAKENDVEYYVETLRDTYPVEMIDVDTMTFTTAGDKVTAIDVTYKTRSAADKKAFDAFIQETLNEASAQTTEKDKLMSANRKIRPIKITKDSSDDLYDIVIRQTGSHVGKTRVFAYILEKLGARFRILKDANGYPYVMTVHNGVANYNCVAMQTRDYVNLTEIVSYSRYNDYPIYDFVDATAENAYMDAWETSKKDISSATISGITTKPYSGRAITQSPKVVVSGKTLTKGTDYLLSYENNINAGTATLYITGKGNYGGSAQKTFTISKKDISILPLFGLKTTYDYTGNAIKPKPTLTDNGKTLVSGTDYTVTYANNTEPGIATITIKGKGNYTRQITASFRIQKKASEEIGTELHVFGVVSSYRYTGKAITLDILVQCGSRTLTKGTDYTVTYKNNTNAGTASVVVKGSGNYATLSKTVTFTISPTSIASLVVSGYQQNYTYTGNAICPAVTVKTGSGTTLKAGTHYTVSYLSNTQKGTAYIVLKGIGNYQGTKLLPFTIK